MGKYPENSLPEFIKRGDERRDKFYVYVIREFVLWISMLLLLCNAMLMIGFLCAGIYEGAVALLTFFGVIAPPVEFLKDAAADGGAAARGEAALVLGLESVEFILLAPLGYVFLSSLLKFIQSLLESVDDFWPSDLRLVTGVKSLATSLLASVVAVDLVGKILKRQALHLEEILLELAIFVVLLAFLLTLERGMRGHEDRAEAVAEPNDAESGD